MASLSGRRANPGSDRGGSAGKYGIEDTTFDEAMSNMENGILHPNMPRNFNAATLDHIEYTLLPRILEEGDEKQAVLCEQVLAKYGRAVPNHVSGLWQPLDVPRNELQVRELFAMRLPEYGYHLVCSQAEFPDWLLVNDEGEFVYTEVEHRSFSFSNHRHDPESCDLIICWEHDWPKSPLPVLELFSGRHFEPKAKRSRRKWKGRLSINFAGRLSRYLTGQRNKYAAQMSGRAEYTLERFADLSSKGIARAEIVKALCVELGVTPQSVSEILRKGGFGAEVTPEGSRARVFERVQALLAEGESKSEAVIRVAEEFNIKKGTVESYLSRHKKYS